MTWSRVITVAEVAGVGRRDGQQEVQQFQRQVDLVEEPVWMTDVQKVQ